MEKWHVLRIWCDFLPEAHDKFSICICPERCWFFWIDSEKPFGRKARKVAVSVPNYWAGFLPHDSYVDTTKMRIIHPDLVAAALEMPSRSHGKIIKAFRDAILMAVESHNALTDEQLAAVRE